MARCKIRQGFFLLKDCSHPARHSCNVCGRAVCEEHSRESEGHRVCTDCLSDKKSTYDVHRRPSDSSLRLRREYHSSRYYSPYYSGSYRNRYYNDYDEHDAKEFDATDDIDQDFDGAEGADDDFDFMDS